MLLGDATSRRWSLPQRYRVKEKFDLSKKSPALQVLEATGLKFSWQIFHSINKVDEKVTQPSFKVFCNQQTRETFYGIDSKKESL